MSGWTPDWSTNTDPAGVAAVLKGAKRVTCLTHSKPDGDAAGSSLAIARSLRHVGVDAHVRYIGPAPHWLGEVAGGTPYHVDGPGHPVTPPGPAPDAIVITDTGSWTQLAEFADWLRPLRERIVVIDHHLHGDGDVARWKLIQTRDAATTQALAPVCAALLGVSVRELPADVVEPLYLGLATDTQWFKLSNVSAPTMALASELLAAGANHTRLYELIEQRDTAARWKLLGRALSTLELHANGRVAIMELTLRDFAECGADRNDTSGFADMVLHIESVRVAAVLTEAETAPGEAPTTKVSMRSKPGPDAVDVNELTMRLGGGGHARAAGARMAGVSLAAARERVLQLLA